jgi:hypothetical protein
MKHKAPDTGVQAGVGPESKSTAQWRGRTEFIILWNITTRPGAKEGGQDQSRVSCFWCGLDVIHFGGPANGSPSVPNADTTF